MKGRKGGRGFPVFRCLYSRSPESIHRWTDLFYRLSHYLFYRPMPACVYYDEGSKTTKVAIRNNGEYARDKYFIYIGGKQLMPIPTVRPPCPCSCLLRLRIFLTKNTKITLFSEIDGPIICIALCLDHDSAPCLRKLLR